MCDLLHVFGPRAEGHVIIHIGVGKEMDVTPLVEVGTYHIVLIILISACVLYSACSHEGFRNLQLPFLLGFFVLSCVIMLGIESTFVAVLQVLIISLIVLYNFVFGEVSFFQFRTNGKWEVGHKDIHTSKSGLAVSVYYPISKDEHKKAL